MRHKTIVDVKIEIANKMRGFKDRNGDKDPNVLMIPGDVYATMQKDFEDETQRMLMTDTESKRDEKAMQVKQIAVYKGMRIIVLPNMEVISVGYVEFGDTGMVLGVKPGATDLQVQ